MNKKFKYTSLVAAGAVTLGLVGGTLAWFRAQDEVVNKFSTTGNEYNPKDPNAGIDIVEDWNEKDGENITPGTDVNKDVQVKNTEQYDQFIRVKFTPQFVKINEDGTHTPYTNEELKNLNISNDMIKLNFTNHLVKDGTHDLNDGYWVQVGEYYYYIGKVGAGSHTNTLLDSVTLSSKAGNEYRGLAFDVVVTADSIQASNKAYESWADESLFTTYETLEKGEATEPVDILEGNGVTTNDGHNH